MKTKKLLAVLLSALMLMTAFVTVASAYGDNQPQAQIVIQNEPASTGLTVQNKLYNVYKVFDVEVFADVAGDGNSDDTMQYTVNADFIDFFNTVLDTTNLGDPTEEEHNSYDDAATTYVTNMTDDMQALVALVREYVLDKDLAVTTTTQTGSFSYTNPYETVRTDAINPGYYLVLDGDDATADVGATAGALVTLPTRATTGELNANAVINLKGSIPTIDKEIWHNDIANNSGVSSPTYGTNGDFETVGDYQVGDTVEFLIECTVPKNLTGYDYYDYIVTDKMSDGLVLDQNSFALYEGDYLFDDSRNYIGGQLHTLSNVSDSGFTFSFNILEIVKAFSFDSFYIYYTATITEYAVNYEEGFEDNTVTLDYSNNPYDKESYGKDEDTVYAYTFKLDVLKTGGDGVTPLADAKFALYEKTLLNVNEATETQIYLSYDPATNEYYPADGVATATDGIITTDSTGEFFINGLDDAKTYILKEIVAPDGYNVADPVEFKISASYKANSAGVPVPTVTATNISNDLSITVINTSAAILPSTGGMGTAMFTTIGAGLMLAAGLFLVIRRRKEAMA